MAWSLSILQVNRKSITDQKGRNKEKEARELIKAKENTRRARMRENNMTFQKRS